MTSMPRFHRASARLGLLALGLLALSPAFAKSTDRDQPMEVNAQHFDGFRKPNSVTTLTGNVVITQGSLRATADQAKVYFDGDNQISRVVLTGQPAHLQQLDDHGNLMLGESATINYQLAKDLAVLTGHATIMQKGRGEAHGDTLAYNTRTSEMRGEGGGDGRVHMIFQPQSKAAPAAAAASAPAPAPAPASSLPAAATSTGQR